MIVSVGYRVKSKRGILQWANKILKQYLIDGYVVNQKRLDYLEKQVNLIAIVSRLDEKIITDEGNKNLRAVIDYNKALTLLDEYDNKQLVRPEGSFG